MVVNNGFIVMFHDLINTKLDSKPSSEAWIKWQLPTNLAFLLFQLIA